MLLPRLMRMLKGYRGYQCPKGRAIKTSSGIPGGPRFRVFHGTLPASVVEEERLDGEDPSRYQQTPQELSVREYHEENLQR